MENKKVTIIIPVYNGSNYIRESITSALNQTYKDTEVIVVNDGSTDGGKTEEIVKSFGDKVKYYSKKNEGIAKTLNFAIKKAEGYYISWLSHDDLYEPTKIEDEINFLNEIKKKDAIVFSDYRYIDGKGKELEEIKISEKILSTNKYFVFYKRLMCGISLLVPKKAINKAKGFNFLNKYTQDYDMWYKLIQKNDFYYLPKTLASIRLHSKQSSNVDVGVVEESEEFWKRRITGESKKVIRDVFGSKFFFTVELYNTFKYCNYENLKKWLSDSLKNEYFDDFFETYYRYKREHDEKIKK